MRIYIDRDKNLPEQKINNKAIKDTRKGSKT